MARPVAQVLLELLRGAKSRGLSADHVLEKYSFTLSQQIVGEVLSRVKSSEIGIGFFRWASKQAGFEHSTHTCNCLLRVLVEDKRPAEAHRLFNDALLAPYRPSIATYNLLIGGYCEGGEMRKALTLVDEMKERNLQPDEETHGLILRGLCNSGKVTEAMKHFKSVTETSGINAVMYDTLIDGFRKASRADEAYQLVEEMIELGFKPGVSVCISLIHALCTAGQVDKGLKLFTEMEKRKIVSPSLVTVNAVIEGLCKAGRLDEALSLRDSKGLKDHTVTYSVLIDGLCRWNKVDKALKLLEEMAGNGLEPDSVILNSIIGGLCKLDLIDEALDFFQRIINPRSKDALMFRTIIDGLCKRNRLAEAKKLLDEMTTGRGLSANALVYGAVIEGLCKSGDVAEACRLTEKMIEKGCSPNTAVYSAVIDGMFKTRKTKEALEQLQKMTIDANRVIPSVVAFCSVIDALCKSERLPEAGWLLRMMNQVGCKPNSQVYNAFLQGLCKAGEMEDARKLFRQMCDDCEPTVVTYNILLDGYCKIVKIEDACHLFAAMVYEGCVPSSVTYDILTDGFCKSGRMSEAYQFAEQADGLPDGLKILLAKLKKLDHVFEILCRMADRGLLKLVTLNSIIQDLHKAGKLDEAAKLSEMLVKMGGVFPALPVSAMALKH